MSAPSRFGQHELEAFHEYLTVAQGASPHTISAYMADVKAFLTDLTATPHAPRSIRHITPAHVQGWLTRQALAHMSPRTTARRLTALRRFFIYGVSRHWLAEPPTALIPLPKVPQTLPKALSEPNVRALLHTPLGTSPSEQRLHLILTLLYASGLRVSELCHLTLADVEEGEGLTLRIRGKGDKTRLVPLGPVAAETLSMYLAQARPRLKGASSPWLLAGPTGRPLTRQRVFQLVQDAGRRVGLTLAPHHLRHTFATHLVGHNADLRAVQLMLGHASLNTTQIYTKVATDHLKDTLNRYHPLNSPIKRTRS